VIKYDFPLGYSSSKPPRRTARPFEVSDLIKKMFLDKDRQVTALLIFVKEHERDKGGVSRQKVIDFMKKEDLFSRVTTLNMINALLQERILLDEKTKNYESRLKVNPEFDFEGLLIEALQVQYNGMEKILESLQPLIKNKNLKMEFKWDKDKIHITFGPFSE